MSANHTHAKKFRPQTITITIALLVASFLAAGTPRCIRAATGPRVGPDKSSVKGLQVTGKRPLIIVPGILNVELVNRNTNEKVWPSMWRAKDDVELPVTGNPLATSDNLVPGRLIESAQFLPLLPRVVILGGMLKALRGEGGYKEGNWESPGADGDHDTFYTFTYDWRRDNIAVAQDLIGQLELLKLKLHRPDLRFDILANSMGGLISRYAAMYGNAEPPADGSVPALTWAGAIHINQILMFGVPNFGSAEAFAALLHGYSITDGPGRHWRLFHKLSREDALTGIAAFQLMPHGKAFRFLDRDLRPLAIDIYDPAAWKKYGWFPSNDPKFRKRLFPENERETTVTEQALEEMLDRHLSIILKRTKVFHQALDVKTGEDPPVSTIAFLADCKSTLGAVVMLSEKEGRWRTLTSPKEIRSATGTEISKKIVIEHMYEPGDGRVTVASALGDTRVMPQTARYDSSALPVSHVYFTCGSHSQLANDKHVNKNAIGMLVRQALEVAGNRPAAPSR